MKVNSLLADIQSKLNTIESTRKELRSLRAQLLDALSKVDAELGTTPPVIVRGGRKTAAKRAKRNTKSVSEAILGVLQGKMRPKEIVAKLPDYNPNSIRQTIPVLVKSRKLKHDKKNRSYQKL